MNNSQMASILSLISEQLSVSQEDIDEPRLVQAAKNDNRYVWVMSHCLEGLQKDMVRGCEVRGEFTKVKISILYVSQVRGMPRVWCELDDL